LAKKNNGKVGKREVEGAAKFNFVPIGKFIDPALNHSSKGWFYDITRKS